VRVQVHSVAWNCSGKRLASGSVDQTARIWHVEPHGHVRASSQLLSSLDAQCGLFRVC
jgi:WD40 repeat protein